ncbi:MAG: DUF951 domain-containing protein [Ruminococcaceae bacterium]|nr:DUF951 domain-containing protein [Oscillospiraceae bacterium]
MPIPTFSVGSTLKMKKPHPCGSLLFAVLRCGSDVRIRCLGCGREVTVPRIKLEKSIKSVREEGKQHERRQA